MLINALDEETISQEKEARKICLCVAFGKLPEGIILRCEELNGKDAPKNSVRLRNIRDGELCTATDICLTKGDSYDLKIDMSRMYSCPYRTTKTGLMLDN